MVGFLSAEHFRDRPAGAGRLGGTIGAQPGLGQHAQRAEQCRAEVLRRAEAEVRGRGVVGPLADRQGEYGPASGSRRSGTTAARPRPGSGARRRTVASPRPAEAARPPNRTKGYCAEDGCRRSGKCACRRRGRRGCATSSESDRCDPRGGPGAAAARPCGFPGPPWRSGGRARGYRRAPRLRVPDIDVARSAILDHENARPGPTHLFRGRWPRGAGREQPGKRQADHAHASNLEQSAARQPEFPPRIVGGRGHQLSPRGGKCGRGTASLYPVPAPGARG